MLALRNSISKTQLDLLSSKIAQRLFTLKELEDAETVSMYLHIGSEVRTSEILAWCKSRGKRVIVPVTDKQSRKLIFSEVKSPERELHVGSYGIPEPMPEFLNSIPLEEAQVVLIPGIAWDLRGYRIGYGGGYYDRSINALHKLIPTIGLAFELQIVRQIPTSQYDRHVGKLVTERRVIATSI
jgi:5-formyltetrahydrofolate cyclo-ligase